MKNVYDIRYENDLTFVLSKETCAVESLSWDAIYKKTAIIIYLYYLDTLPIYYEYIRGIPRAIDVYVVSSRERVLEETRERVNACPEKKIHYILKENRGRDVSALLVTGREIVARYEYVCFLHDKKEHSADRKKDTQLWIRNLWENQIGGPAYIRNVLALFEGKAELGILAPPEPIGKNFSTWYGYGWGDSFEVTRRLVRKLGLNTNINLNKPPITLGTVLWFRRDALKKLFDAGWRHSDFDDEKLNSENYLSYGIERVFAYVAQDAGYHTATVMTSAYAETQLNFLQYTTSQLFSEIDLFFPINNIGGLERYKRNKGKMIDYAKRNKEIYLYGAGKMGRLCAALLRAENIRPKAYLVSGSDGAGEVECIPVIAADKQEGMNDMAVIITVCERKAQEEIAGILKKKGCRNYIKFWDY